MASEAVARIQSLKSDHEPSGVGQYVPGYFYRLVNDTTGLGGGGLIRVGAIVIRGNTFAVARESMPLCIGDRVRTGPETFAAIEFLIGGRVGINKGTEVVVISERAVADGNNGVGRAALKAGGSAFDVLTQFTIGISSGTKLQIPLEIQTNGGVMGVKG